jgi:hypothetical protein
MDEKETVLGKRPKACQSNWTTRILQAMKSIKINWSLVDKKIEIDIVKARLNRNRKLKKIFK